MSAACVWLPRSAAGPTRSGAVPPSPAAPPAAVSARPPPPLPPRQSARRDGQRRQIRGVDGVARSVTARRLQNGVQLAQVARPGVGQHNLPGIRRQSLYRAAAIGIQPPQQTVYQMRQLVAALAQRRQVDAQRRPARDTVRVSDCPGTAPRPHRDSRRADAAGDRRTRSAIRGVAFAVRTAGRPAP